MLFEDLNLITPINKALKTEGYVQPTPIQEAAIPTILEGKDFLGCAQTGTGKTAAFAIPILQILCGRQKVIKGPKNIKALILAPTRELAIQIGESFTAYSKHMNLTSAVIFGGVSQKKQTDALKDGVDILIATTGRLLDLMQQKYINIHHVEMFVLDEADRMLDMGFLRDVKKIIAQLPKIRQTMLFSATMPPEISKLVDSILVDPVKVAVTPVSSTIELIEQSVYFVDKKDKKPLLIHLLKDKSIVSALVFSRTKHGANKITKDLNNVGIEAQAIHGNKSQSARQLALNNFKSGITRVLVATDIAARGIDVDELSHVINFDLPNIPETYVHRIGRTGRAGLGGVALSFCDEEEKPFLKDIQKVISKSIPVIEDHPYPASNEPVIASNDKANKPSTRKPQQSGNARRNGRNQGGSQQPKNFRSTR
ncbi:DEAD/DEAH box helicase [Clostridium sp. CM028]|uniref:DEAD/DEAH box helicase n=1 Tax=unclassified Clostridium TaxID=2614128 RepID=UPI001C0CB020|nr:MULTISPECIES: DEAD/DEAH box helicase [unclassified Clostridium]MBU3091886.1 DEAD/DEAH box helicase [Clostridium sp. CF011]MBW9147735.1 DEAD/DEAH box helicase [Clostridium sp. CM028]WAG70403.1 DEAD/DEAH box helicase [Clostridium sp. CF011]WLC62058.1 DEAD/DEAH box helicase [Clostridium sp. CM028]